jgi:hypothetical protein
MTLKHVLSHGLETFYETVIDRVDTLFATAEVYVEQAFPDGVSTAAKADALARWADTHGRPEHAQQLRAGLMPDAIVSAAYAVVAVAFPEFTVDESTGPVEEEAPKTPAQYLAYLKKHFPTMAKVYAQTLLEQERQENAGHKYENEDTDPDA